MRGLPIWRVLNVAAMLSGIAVLMLVLSETWHRYKEARALPEMLQRFAARRFQLLQEEILSAKRKVQSRDNASTNGQNVMAAAWEEYLSSSPLCDSYVQSYCSKRHEDLILLIAEVRGPPGERDAVAVPNRKDNSTAYVVMHYMSSEANSSRPFAVLAYSPSRPDRIYLAPASSGTDVTRILLDTVREYDWSTPFEPPSEAWPEFYPIHTADSSLGPLTRREELRALASERQ